MNTFSISEALSFGWDTFKKNVSFFIILIVILGIIQGVGQFAPGRLAEEGSAISLLISLLFVAVSLITSIGLTKITLDLVDGKAGNLHDLYQQYPLALKYIGASILTAIIVIVGFILLIIPGIYLSIKLLFTPYLVVDKKLGPVDAVKGSYDMTKGNWWNLLFLQIVSGLIIIAGVIALLVGLFVAIPVVTIAMGYVYRKLSGGAGQAAVPVTTTPEPAPAVTPEPAAGVVPQS